MVPFLTPIKLNGSNLAAYIALVNHNKINTGLTSSIASTMMGRFTQDGDKDTSQLQEMGSDTRVFYLVTRKKWTNLITQIIQTLNIFFA